VSLNVQMVTMKPITVPVPITTIVDAAKSVIPIVLLVTDLLMTNVMLVLMDSMPNQIPPSLV